MNDLVVAAESNLSHALAVLARCADGGGTVIGRGFVAAYAAASIRSFNNILITSADIAGRELERVVHDFLSSGRRFRLRARVEIATELAPTLSSLGLREAGGIPCLALTGRVRDASPSVADIRQVADEASLRDHVAVVADVFGWEASALASVLRTGVMSDDRWSGYVAYVDGAPVASSQAIIDGPTVGVYYVGTREAGRRRGLGSAMTRRAIAGPLAAGCEVASLQASPMGRPIYEQMGFREVAYYRTYAGGD